jgi:hypothetical protein
MNSLRYHLIFSGSGLNRCFFGYIREDRSYRKVYFIDNLGNAEVLLYDFSMELGDTISCDFYYNGIGWWNDFKDGADRLDSLQTIYIGSVNLKTYYLSNADTTSATLIWHEGLGSLIHPFYLYRHYDFGCSHYFGSCGHYHIAFDNLEE